MPQPQFIHTETGEELVVLTRADYEHLLARTAAEDEEDVAIYDARKAELAAGAPCLPEPVSAAMLKGASLLKAVRQWRGLSQIALARRAGLGQGYLSDLEARRRAGTQATLEKLAAALDIPPGWLS